MNPKLIDLIEKNPVIAAIKSDSDLTRICKIEEIGIVFILYGDITNLKSIVTALHKAGKVAFVHADLINGLSGREIVVDFIKDTVEADGVISTKAPIIKRAVEIGMYTILRFFVLDSLAYNSIEKNLAQVKPDCYEIMPGVMPKIIKKLSGISDIPLITGGLVADKDDVIQALSAGALAVSTTNHEVWTCMIE